eukprot:2124027-Rhodomonas_salina.1
MDYCLVATDLLALLVGASGLIVGVDDSVRGDTVSVVRGRPCVDGVVILGEHGGLERNELADLLEHLSRHNAYGQIDNII